MLPDNNKSVVLENNTNNKQEKDGIEYLHNERITNIASDINRGKIAQKNRRGVQNIETYDLLEDAKMRGKNCVDTGTYRNNRKY